MHYISQSASAVSFSILLEKLVLLHLPFGGSITLGHHVPLIYISFKYGWKLGVFTSIIYCIIHIILSFKVPPVKNFISFIFIIFLDYILPYVFIGLSSVFKLKIKSKFFRVFIGIITSFIINLCLSTISGVVLWKEYIPFNINIWLYSIIYNSLHIIPQMIITVILLKYIIKFNSFTTL